MAKVFAHRKLEARGPNEEIVLTTGGTRPVQVIHPLVVEAIGEVGSDIFGRPRREVTVEDLQQSGPDITMGCSADNRCPAGCGGETRDWDLDDPDGRTTPEIREIRDEIERRGHH